MELTISTPQKNTQFKEQQPQTAAFKIVGVLKAHTNNCLKIDRITFCDAPLTYSRGNLD